MGKLFPGHLLVLVALKELRRVHLMRLRPLPITLLGERWIRECGRLR
jgi:hypothetical protein